MAEKKYVAGVEIDDKEVASKVEDSQTQKVLTFESYHLKLTQVMLMDDTDRHNELVQTREWLLHKSEKKLALQGNLFIVQDSFTKKGKIFIKKAQLPHARPEQIEADLKVAPLNTGWDIILLSVENTNEWVILDFEGAQFEITKVLQEWQAAQRPNTAAHKEPRFLSNTWGDRSRDGAISESFIKQEIDAALELGVEVVQIDDGWQKGVSANSTLANEDQGVWEGFWASDPEFWTANPERLPNGIEPLVEYADCKGVELGLWFAPDSYNEFENWQKDVDFILGTFHKYGIKHFKLDSIKAETQQANQNLQQFFSAVNTASKGEIVFDLDITAGIRPGYFGALQVGPLFVENRYTDFANYWPHQTLRNLWKLSNWIDPKRLRMEFLNNTRNTENYAGSPIAPVKYPPATLFATVMFANPLGWFEISNLPKTYIEEVAPLVKIWKNHRAELFSNTIIPIGSAPDGIEYTGFMSVPTDNSNGYLLLFREANENAETEFEMSACFQNRQSVEVLFGDGSAAIDGSHIRCTINHKFNFIFCLIS